MESDFLFSGKLSAEIETFKNLFTRKGTAYAYRIIYSHWCGWYDFARDSLAA